MDERSSRTNKDATVKCSHYARHDKLRRHLRLFVYTYSYGRLIAEKPPEAIHTDPVVIRAYLGQGSAARQAAAETREAAHA